MEKIGKNTDYWTLIGNMRKKNGPKAEKSKESRKKGNRPKNAHVLEEKNKLNAIIDSIGDGIIAQDIDFKIIYQNQNQNNLFGDRVESTVTKRMRAEILSVKIVQLN